MAGHTQSSRSSSGFGGWLRTERERQGLKQREVAAALDMDASHLGKIERNERLPPPERATAFAAAYRLDPKLFKAYYACSYTKALFPDEPETHLAAGHLLCEAVPPVNNPVDKPANKK